MRRLVALGALLLIGAPALFVLAGGGVYTWWINPRVIEEVRSDPNGERAKKVMVLTLPSGKTIPVNYLRDGDTVYAAADFPWWHELQDGGGRATTVIRGETLSGHIRAVTDDPELRSSVFERLRPQALSFAGTLVVIDLDSEDAR